MLGVHLEGPFINKKYKGMQKEECCVNPDMNLMKELVDIQGADHLIRLMTLAPELEESMDLIQFCKSHGIQCSIGHSDATFDIIKKLKSYGLSGVTHMFSGMRRMHHRELGVVGYAHVKKPFHHYIRKETFIPTEQGLCILKEDGTKILFNPIDYDQVKHLEMSYNESVVNLSKHSFVSPLDMIKMTSWNPAIYWCIQP